MALLPTMEDAGVAAPGNFCMPNVCAQAQQGPQEHLLGLQKVSQLAGVVKDWGGAMGHQMAGEVQWRQVEGK